MVVTEKPKRKFRLLGVCIRNLFLLGLLIVTTYYVVDFQYKSSCVQKKVNDDKIQVQENPLLILVTPTYVRASQAIHLTQLNNVLRLVQPPILWVVVESEEVVSFL